MYADERVLLLN